MKKIILTAVLGSAALGLAACDNAADDVEESTTVVTEDPAMDPAPAVTETAPSDTATPTDGSTVSVGPDGVEADVDAGDARVRTDGDGTTTVTTD
jgi:hypothetical protein